MEGIGDNIGGILEQAQKFRRTGIHDLLRLGMDLLADAAKLALYVPEDEDDEDIY